MLVVMRDGASAEDIARVCQTVRGLGWAAHPIPGPTRTAIGITGNPGPVDPAPLQDLPGVLELIPVTRPYKLVGREWQPEPSIVRIGGVAIGGPEIVVVAGPCSVESREQTVAAARAVHRAGARLLRGGAFKPRTSPYSFQGLGAAGLAILAEVREATGLPVVSEAIDAESFDLAEPLVDAIQIGARNMQNFALLRRAGRSPRPVLLKRCMAATAEELLLAAEYIVAEGNRQVILCERGIRSFNDYSRYTLDLGIVPELKRRTHLPVLVDPSHAAGRRDLVGPLARAAVAVGADGILVEVHPDPDRALSDGPQALTPPMFDELMNDLRGIACAVRRIAPRVAA